MPATFPAARSPWLLLGLALSTLLAGACSGRGGRRASLDVSDHYRRCETTADDLSPLLVEWPSTERSTLEAELHRSESLIVVRYTGCDMEILRGCERPGRYQWTEVSRKRDRIEIQSAADVWAKVPLAAVELVGAVERYGALQLDMQLVGQYAAPDFAPDREQLSGRECERATHVVSSLIVGAFAINEASGTRVEAGVEARGIGVGGGGSKRQRYFSSDGELTACSEAGYNSYGPTDKCKSPLQIQLVPLLDTAPDLPLTCPRDMALIETRPGEGFCLDRHEVTVSEYAACAADHTCSEAPSSVDWPGVDEDDHERYDPLCNRDRGQRSNHPVNCLTYDQAASYCRAQGKRLPTSSEWLWAARGGEQNRSYPWGEDAPSHRLANACGKECEKAFEDKDKDKRKRKRETGEDEDAYLGYGLDDTPEYEGLYPKSDGYVGTAPIGSFPAGTARWELLDMGGNVWEWADDPNYGGLIVGGSAFSTSARQLSSRSSDSVEPSSRRADIGMRCAAAAKPLEGDKRRRRR